MPRRKPKSVAKKNDWAAKSNVTKSPENARPEHALPEVEQQDNSLEAMDLSNDDPVQQRYISEPSAEHALSEVEQQDNSLVSSYCSCNQKFAGLLLPQFLSDALEPYVKSTGFLGNRLLVFC